MGREKVSHGVCKGMEFQDPDIRGLAGNLVKRILRVMARVSEASYRRGVQQGALFHMNGEIGGDLWEYRYAISLDKAPCADIPKFPTITGMPSAHDRLVTEYGNSLSEWGLYQCPDRTAEIIQLSDERMVRRVKSIGRDGLTDSEIVGGAFCDGISAGVDPQKLHESYMNTTTPDEFEAAVWLAISQVRGGG